MIVTFPFKSGFLKKQNMGHQTSKTQYLDDFIMPARNFPLKIKKILLSLEFSIVFMV